MTIIDGVIILRRDCYELRDIDDVLEHNGLIVTKIDFDKG